MNEEIQREIRLLQANPGDIVVLSGWDRSSWDDLRDILDESGWREKHQGVFFVRLPVNGAIDIRNWEWLKQWQEERLSDG